MNDYAKQFPFNLVNDDVSTNVDIFNEMTLITETSINTALSISKNRTRKKKLTINLSKKLRL